MQNAPRKANLNLILASLFVIFVGALFFMAIWDIRHVNPNRFYILLGIGLLSSYNIFRIFTSKFRRRAQILEQPFPNEWRNILNTHIHFYVNLKKEEKRKFEQRIQIFIAEKRITGIKTEVDDTVRVLVAASAIIPIFAFDEWEYDNLGEVLIYPGSFNQNFEQKGKDRAIAGMVGSGAMNGIMILSKPALINGFLKTKDSYNVGIHEFVHLIDAQDGAFDGIPALMTKPYVIPWLNLMHEEISKIHKGDSRLRDYGGTNKVEFFAVSSEYFFEHPEDMEKHHPELYKMLEHVFQQDMTERISIGLKSMLGYTGKKIGRNAACPCGSGKKYKHCCLK